MYHFSRFVVLSFHSKVHVVLTTRKKVGIPLPWEAVALLTAQDSPANTLLTAHLFCLLPSFSKQPVGKHRAIQQNSCEKEKQMGKEHYRRKERRLGELWRLETSPL